jgi:hypothetical protein
MVGTRGVFGEGWDSIALNTLVDLTAVTASTSVQQLRGRSIRLDPTWPRKVAHNWDVVCVAPGFQHGDNDLQRFSRRHGRYWGLAAPSRVVKGVAHVDLDLAWDMARKPFNTIDYELYNSKMLAQVPQREQAYNMWDVGGGYDNSLYSASRLEVEHLKIRTAFTVEHTLARMLRDFRVSLVVWVVIVLYFALRSVAQVIPMGDGVALFTNIWTAFVAVGILVFAANVRSALRIGRAALVAERPDAILLDVGRAVLMSLREAGLLSETLRPEDVRVYEQPDASFEVTLDRGAPEEAAIFIEAYRQVFARVRDQRYLVLRDDGRLPQPGLRLLWLLLRPFFGRSAKPAYHPVPDVLAARKELAEIFAQHWDRYVGGGRLVFTRSDAGRRVLLEARARPRPDAGNMAFELWR